MIRAHAHSDDHRYSLEFDATPWIEEATGAEIRKLAEQGFASDYAADSVAQAVGDWELTHREPCDEPDCDSPLNKMFAYLSLIPNAEERGFECSVNEDDVWAWLKGDDA